ncbi:MAG: hypothetical protein R3E10_11360 [Gemmatimonadota bacterium]
MRPPKPPKIAAVQVVAAQPTEVDRVASAQAGRAEPPAAVYVVLVRLKEKPPATGLAWRLYAGDELIPKYWEYSDGIYFTVSDRQFFARHRGKRLRFSLDGTEFADTGAKLPARLPSLPEEGKVRGKRATLPKQSEVVG